MSIDMETLLKICNTPVSTATHESCAATATTGIIQIKPARTRVNLEKLAIRLYNIDNGKCTQGPKISVEHSFIGQQTGVVLGRIYNGNYFPNRSEVFNIQSPEDFETGTIVLMENLRPLCQKAFIIAAVDDLSTINYFHKIFGTDKSAKNHFKFWQPEAPWN
jgi:hypothetical protein